MRVWEPPSQRNDGTVSRVRQVNRCLPAGGAMLYHWLTRFEAVPGRTGNTNTDRTGRRIFKWPGKRDEIHR